MTVSSVSSTSATVSVPASSNDNSLAALEKQQQTLQQDITKENQSKDDAATKQKAVQALQQQLDKVNAQVQAQQASAAKASSQSGAASTTTQSTSASAGSSGSAGLVNVTV